MSRLSQFMSYLNAEKHPTALDKIHFYTHAELDESTKKVRRKYRKELDKDKK